MIEWTPRPEVLPEEEAILKLCRKQKLWGFLRRYQHLILDEEVRGALQAMYREAGPGRPPVAPEVLVIAMLLQVGFDVADHEVPTLTAVDARWQVVLGCLGSTAPAFSQGTVFNFRERARAHGFMQRVLERTVQIARETGGYSHKRLRALIDSSPLVGAGRVEDTFNLLGRALAGLVETSAAQAGRDMVELANELEVTVALGSSVKAVLDVDWREPGSRADALRELLEQFERLQAWLREQFDEAQLKVPPLADSLAVVKQIIDQDTEPEPPPDGAGENRLREGVAKDRLISLSDPDMRHGRKSKTKKFSGYKRHIAGDADLPGLITAVEVLPANRPEREGAAPLLNRLGEVFDVTELQIDRGYLTSKAVLEHKARGVAVISKPPTPRKGPRYGKAEFTTDFEAQTLTCPVGATVPVPPSRVAWFPREKCQVCHSRESCITDRNKKGRQVKLHPQERWYREMAEELATPAGRARRRERVVIEHDLALVSQIQGNRARYRGRDKNQAHLELVGAVANLYVIGRLFDQKQAA